MLRFSISLLLALGALAIAPDLVAQEKPCTFSEADGNHPEARKSYESGLKAMEQGNADEAIKLFEEAKTNGYAHYPPLILNLGMALENRRKYLDARSTYGHLTCAEDTKIPSLWKSDLTSARSAQTELEKKIPTVTFEFSGPYADHAVVMLDGDRLPTTELNRKKQLDPGQHQYTFEFKFEDHELPVKRECLPKPKPEQLDLVDNDHPNKVLSILAPWPADEDPEKLFDTGLKEAENNNWADASEHFGSSGGNPAAVFNHAFAELHLGKRYAAFKALAKLPTNSGDPVEERAKKCRDAIRKKLATLQVTVAQDGVDLSVKRDGADAHLHNLGLVGTRPQYSVDSVEEGSGQGDRPTLQKGSQFDVVLEPGIKYRFFFKQKPNDVPKEQDIKLTEQETKALIVPPEPIPPNPEPTPPKQIRDWRFGAGMALIVVGGVAVGAGVASNVVWYNERKAILSDPLQCPRVNLCYEPASDTVNNHWGITTFYLLAGTGVLAGFVGGGLLIWQGHDSSKTQPASTHSTWIVEPALKVGPRGIAVEGRFF